MIGLRARGMRLAFRHARHMSVRAGHYAVLIDADNVPPRLCAAILEEVGQRVQGTNVDRRVYGDFSLPRIEAWKTAALEHGIATIMQTSPSKTKNATDIALCIDAMDILHAPNSLVDTFVLVTNMAISRRLRSGCAAQANALSPSALARRSSPLAMRTCRLTSHERRSGCTRRPTLPCLRRCFTISRRAR